MEPLASKEGASSLNEDEIPKGLVGVDDALSDEVAEAAPHGTDTPRRMREAVRQRSKFFAKALADTSVPHQPLRLETLAQLSCRCQMGVFL